MARDPFARASQSVLRRLGKDALLRGEPAGKVHIEHGVEVYERTAEHEALVRRTVADIERQYEPQRDDTLARFEDDGTPILPTYKIGPLVSDNGYIVRRVVLEVA